jgi:hypothetical protein
MMPDQKDIKNILLGVVKKHSEIYSLQQDSVLSEVKSLMGNGATIELQEVILTTWYDLFRSGHLSWGSDLSNVSPPFFHLTEKGKKFLSNFSRDPANPTGYLENIKKFKINDVALSYVYESVNSYNNNCYKAAAVMIGCASESMILELRDTLVAKMAALGKTANPKLNNERIKTVIDEIEVIIESNKKNIPKPLFESFSTYWTALSGQIRISRNEAGHPNSVDPVTEDSVHASLLLFPEILKLIGDISEWINNHYS